MFLFDYFQAYARKEQMADACQEQVPLDGVIAAALEVIEPQQPLFILETSFNMPTRKSHVQDALDRCGR